jgi:exosortase family protein XrtM
MAGSRPVKTRAARWARSGPGAFALRFALAFGLLMAGFEATRGTDFERFVVDGLFVAPAAATVNVLAPGTRAAAEGRAIASPEARLRVLRGCEGIETILLVVAAVLAFPATWRQRAGGLIVGVVLGYALSIGRLAFLFLSLRYFAATYEWTHGLIAPLVPVGALALFFLAWSGRTGPVRPPPRGGTAAHS